MNSSALKLIVGGVVSVVIALVLMPTIISSIDTTITAITASSNTYGGVSALLQVIPIVFVAGILGYAYIQVKKNKG
tara:strand:+ start:308 stop:535 length:228 start_codon:yes stop_codon:yes gene_type:complete